MSEHRPIFTGDVMADVAIPGVQESGAAIVLAHPCSIRGKNAELADSILVGAVDNHQDVPPHQWETGYLNRMPLPELRGPGTEFEVAWLDRIGLADSTAVHPTNRIACLSPYGVNLLQQRLVAHLTRVDIPTAKFWEAFGHTFEEADLLEEWTEELAETLGCADSAAEFESWIRDEERQDRLRDPQQRASVRSEMRAELRDRDR